MEFLQTVILGNTLGDWLLALLVYLLAHFLLLLGKRAAMNWLARLVQRAEALGGAEHGMNRLVEDLGRRTNSAIIALVALFFASRVLSLPVWLDRALGMAAVLALILQVGLWGMAAINFWSAFQVEKEKENKAAVSTTMNAVRLVLLIALWSLVGLAMTVALTGMSASSVITALGIVSVAAALAVQNVLGDLISSLSISLDKPFVIGDAIWTEGFEGTVEKIGLKSTQVRSVDGEMLIFSNSFLLNNPLKNLSRRERRRVLFYLTISYKTPSERLAQVEPFVREQIATQEQVTFDRVVLKTFTNLGAQFECVYYIETPDFARYLQVLQAVNQGIQQRFAEEGIEFAENFDNLAVAGP